MRESSRRADYRPRGARAAVIRVLFTVARILLLSFCVPFILAAHENSFGGRRRWNRDVYLDVNRSHGASFTGRIGVALVIGVLAAITTNVSYWNWYGFPSSYTASYMCIQIVGFLLVGVVAALLLPKPVSTV